MDAGEPEIRVRCAELGMEYVGATSDQFAKLISQELATLAEVAEAAKVKFE